MKKWLLIAIILVAVLVLAAVAYPFLKDIYIIYFAPVLKWQDPVPAPEMTLTDENGEPHALSEFYGKPILLNFWATWCPGCVEEMPVFDTAAATHGEEFTFLMVNLVDGERDTVEGAKAFVQENGCTFPLYFDMEDAAWERFGLLGIPTTVLIDSDGCVVGRWFASMTQEELEELLGSFRELENEQ